jgi:hypothetical protein
VGVEAEVQGPSHREDRELVDAFLERGGKGATPIGVVDLNRVPPGLRVLVVVKEVLPGQVVLQRGTFRAGAHVGEPLCVGLRVLGPELGLPEVEHEPVVVAGVHDDLKDAAKHQLHGAERRVTRGPDPLELEGVRACRRPPGDHVLDVGESSSSLPCLDELLCHEPQGEQEEVALRHANPQSPRNPQVRRRQLRGQHVQQLRLEGRATEEASLEVRERSCEVDVRIA